MPVMIAINVWKLFPFVAIMVLAGLQSIPNDLYEAAAHRRRELLGRGLCMVMLPQVRHGDHGRHVAAGDLGAELTSPSSTPSPGAARPTAR